MKHLLFFCSLLFFNLLSFSQISQVTTLQTNGNLENSSMAQDSEYNTFICATQYLPFGAISKGLNIYKLNACNELIWNKTYYRSGVQLENKQIVVDEVSGFIYIIGFYIDHIKLNRQLMVIKLDEYGNILDTKALDFDGFELSYAYNTLLRGNGLVIFAKYAPIGGGASYSSILTLNSDLEIEKSNRFLDSYTGLSVAKFSDDVYFIRTHHFVGLVDVDGTVYWFKKYTELLNGSSFFRSLKTDDGFIVLVRLQNDNYLVKLNHKGEFIWKSDVFETVFWPEMILDKDKNVQVFSFLFNAGMSYPISIHVSAEDGEIFNQSQINLGANGVSTFPTVIAHENTIDFLMHSTNADQLIFVQNANHTICNEELNLPLHDNLYGEDYSNLSVTTTKLIENNSLEDFTLDSLPSHFVQSILCAPVITEDTLFITGKIDCDISYDYQGTKEGTYFWLQDGSFDSEKILDSVGIYEVVISDCRSKTREIIEIKTICNCKLQMPNAFTPNNDGDNDEFGGVDYCDVEHYSMRIYDRWGKQMFQSKNINQKWDGTYKGTKVSSGMYYYVVEFTPASLSQLVQNKTISGYVMVLY